MEILPFRSVVQSGEAMRDRVTTVAPTPDDTAIVMYTSGSTGTPKVQQCPILGKHILMIHVHIILNCDESLCAGRVEGKKKLRDPVSWLPLAANSPNLGPIFLTVSVPLF